MCTPGFRLRLLCVGFPWKGILSHIPFFFSVLDLNVHTYHMYDLVKNYMYSCRNVKLKGYMYRNAKTKAVS